MGIVDDHPTFRVGLRRLLEQEHELTVAWDMGTLSEMDDAMAANPVDTVLMDLSLGPNEDSLAATRRLVDKKSGIKVIVISASFDPDAVTAARQAGAVGYLPKDLPAADMVAAVKTLALESTDHRAFADFAIGRKSTPHASYGLTKRELEVVFELRRGRTNREIALDLGVSIPTVNKHVQQVLKKLHVRNRAQALARLHHEALVGFSKA
ncbi:MAG: response regulator transcription factor [Candidatus Dormibacteraceae bacterium]